MDTMSTPLTIGISCIGLAAADEAKLAVNRVIAVYATTGDGVPLLRAAC